MLAVAVAVAVAAAVAVIGLLLLIAALTPGAPTVLPLTTTPGQPDTGATRASLTRALTATAADVDGVDKAAVRLRRTTLTATGRTPLRDPAGLAEHVRAALGDRLDDLAPTRRPRIRIASPPPPTADTEPCDEHPNRPARLNRTLLALLGLLLVLAGAFGLGLLTGLLPALDPTTPLVPTGVTVQNWVPYLAIVVAVLLGLLCLRWLLAQALRRPKTSTWRLPVDSGRGTTRLDTDHAAAAADIATYPGVAKATATLTGPRPQPVLHLEVSTETGTRIGPLRDRITTHALPRLRHALDLDTLPTDLLLRLDTTTGDRTH